ncbi:hypothetical protein DSO57_1030188 [Entomophthora muscae]|uniref:Uncharacterized protein n=1 Tax=Entomophthora muscae TaxID=34485 RepID=A0ACC2UBC6_9FUNG|nr:hypothetical protein DSO57_1030188 [Entomophthora muscae]
MPIASYGRQIRPIDSYGQQLFHHNYIPAYKGLCDQAPSTINFDNPGPQLDFYNGLPTHIQRQFDMNRCKNLEDVFLEGKRAAQKSDNPHESNK